MAGEKRVSYDDFSEAFSKLEEYSIQHGGRVHFSSRRRAQDPVIEMGVGWASIGAVSPEEVEEFAQMLTEAAEMARNFEYNGYVIFFGEGA